jgi:hypothetical protein
MKKYLLILLVIAINPAFAFDYHGIKSVMTKEKVSSVLAEIGVKTKEVSFISDVKLNGVEIVPYIMTFEYDYQNKLYKIEMTYMGHHLEGVNTVAFHQALTEKYKAEIEIERGSLKAILLDSKLQLKNILHYKNELLGKI